MWCYCCCCCCCFCWFCCYCYCDGTLCSVDGALKWERYNIRWFNDQLSVTTWLYITTGFFDSIISNKHLSQTQSARTTAIAATTAAPAAQTHCDNVVILLTDDITRHEFFVTWQIFWALLKLNNFHLLFKCILLRNPVFLKQSFLNFIFKIYILYLIIMNLIFEHAQVEKGTNAIRNKNLLLNWIIKKIYFENAQFKKKTNAIRNKKPTNCIE